MDQRATLAAVRPDGWHRHQRRGSADPVDPKFHRWTRWSTPPQSSAARSAGETIPSRDDRHRLEGEVVPLGLKRRGREEMRQLIEGSWADYPQDGWHEITNVFGSREWVCLEYTARGTMTKELPHLYISWIGSQRVDRRFSRGTCYFSDFPPPNRTCRFHGIRLSSIVVLAFCKAVTSLSLILCRLIGRP